MFCRRGAEGRRTGTIRGACQGRRAARSQARYREKAEESKPKRKTVASLRKGRILCQGQRQACQEATSLNLLLLGTRPVDVSVHIVLLPTEVSAEYTQSMWRTSTNCTERLNLALTGGFNPSLRLLLADQSNSLHFRREALLQLSKSNVSGFLLFFQFKQTPAARYHCSPTLSNPPKHFL